MPNLARSVDSTGRKPQFYDLALPVVYGYFFRRCGGRREIAEELTQETFVSVVRSLNTGTQVDAPLPWVVSIATGLFQAADQGVFEWARQDLNLQPTDYESEKARSDDKEEDPENGP